MLVLTGCSVALRPLDRDQLLTDSKKSLRDMQGDMNPIGQTIDLDEAIARGLKYNLDFRVKQYEEALAVNQKDIASLEMLPKVIGQAGYYKRNNDPINTSVDAATGAPSTSRYISTDRTIRSADLGLSWNILDFGASYFSARQEGDRMLIALEKRRKAMHNLVQDIRTAYLRAYAAQLLEAEVNTTIKMSEEALKHAKQAELEKLRSPADILKTEKTILDNLRILESVNQELSTARHELNAYMNAPQGSNYTLASPDKNLLSPKQLALPMDSMEDLAILNNADFREQLYTARIAKDEVKKNMLKLFPGISFNYSGHENSNSFLVNSHWQDAAVQVSWNLLNVLSIPAQMSASKNANEVHDKRRAAVLMGLITQVHIASLQYENAYQAYQRSESILNIDARLNHISQTKVNEMMESKLEHVTYSTSYILSLLRKYQALSQLYTAEGRLRSTLGQEIVVGDLSQVPLEKLKDEVNLALKSWIPDTSQ